MSSTSASRRQRLAARLLARLVFGFGAIDLAVRVVPDRNLMAPPELARDAPGPDVAHPAEIDVGPVARARIWSRRSSTAAIALSASGCDVQIPLLGQERLQHDGLGLFVMRHGMGDRLDLVEQLERFQIGDDLLARRLARSGRDRAPGTSSFSVPSLLRMLISGRLWRLPTSKSLKSWPGVILTAPVPFSGSECSSAMIGISRPGQRQHRRSCRPAPCSAHRRDAPPPRCRPAWFRAAWWRR